MEIVWIILAIVVVFGLFVWGAYNSLVTLRTRVDEAWSDITVQLKRRLDLIPNLVETVKGYAKHETSVFEAVTTARAATQCRPRACTPCARRAAGARRGATPSGAAGARRLVPG